MSPIKTGRRHLGLGERLNITSAQVAHQPKQSRWPHVLDQLNAHEVYARTDSRLGKVSRNALGLIDLGARPMAPGICFR